MSNHVNGTNTEKKKKMKKEALQKGILFILRGSTAGILFAVSTGDLLRGGLDGRLVGGGGGLCLLDGGG